MTLSHVRNSFVDTVVAEKTGAAFSILAADIYGGLVSNDGQTIATAATLDTGANMDAAAFFGYVGTFPAYAWSLINENTSSGDVTVTESSGHTVTGSAVVAVGTSGRFHTARTTTETWITFRVA